MSSSNYLKNVAIVGAGGNSGRYMTEALVAAGKHIITALTRADSTSILPKGVITKQISYSDPSTLVAALRGQDVLIITMSPTAQANTSLLIHAAAEAEVPWVLPNDWGSGTAAPALIQDVPAFAGPQAQRDLIASLGKSAYVSVATGFWYEWSLSLEFGYGFDIPKREATFFDEGDVEISTSTWPQVGRAVASLLSLPVKPEDGRPAEESKCLERYRNKIVYVDSFTVTQRDMFASLLRVTETKESDWTVKKEPSRERYEQGKKDFMAGSRLGFARMMYSRTFFGDAKLNFREGPGVENEVLGLPKEDLDEATKRAVERAEVMTFAYDARMSDQEIHTE